MAAPLDLHLDRNLRHLRHRIHLCGHLPLWKAKGPAHQRRQRKVYLGHSAYAHDLHLGYS